MKIFIILLLTCCEAIYAFVATTRPRAVTDPFFKFDGIDYMDTNPYFTPKYDCKQLFTRCILDTPILHMVCGRIWWRLPFTSGYRYFNSLCDLEYYNCYYRMKKYGNPYRNNGYPDDISVTWWHYEGDGDKCAKSRRFYGNADKEAMEKARRLLSETAYNDFD